jgi:hypothetical protein
MKKTDEEYVNIIVSRTKKSNIKSVFVKEYGNTMIVDINWDMFLRKIKKGLKYPLIVKV